MLALCIHTHCQVAQKSHAADQNLSKSMAAQTHSKNADPDKTKISASIERKCLIENKAQHLTINIRNAGLETWTDKTMKFGCISAILIAIISAIVGIVTIIKWII
tara:strand:- start:936 stop:1250 length:315 start_codon:yes stop_codon:yes gene_type:complete